MIRSFICALFFLLFLAWSAQAQEMFVRNRPFKGTMIREGRTIWVAVEPFAKAVRWKLTGGTSTGYALSEDGSAQPSAAGELVVGGESLPYRLEEDEALVPLRQIAELVGAKVVENKELATIDINLAKRKGEVSSARSFSSKRYTLIEYSSPPDKLCQYIQPVLRKAREKYGDEVAHQLCDVRKGGLLSQYMKYKKTKDASFPEVVLIDSGGQILFQLRGNHVIDKELMNSLRKTVR